MYTHYHGLHQKPFELVPDPRYLYFGPMHREAVAGLTYGIRERKGFLLLVGQPGCGKTTILRHLIAELDAHTRPVLVFNTEISFEELLRVALRELDLADRIGSKEAMLNALSERLLEEYRAGRSVLLVIDEAQNLTDSVLESVRMLSNLETDRDKLLQILLVGQPALWSRLQQPHLQQLRQRIAVVCHLGVLTRVETARYVARRLAVAGAERPLFTGAALFWLHRYSGGIPRVINVLADRALVYALARRKRRATAAIVRKVAAADQVLAWRSRQARAAPTVRREWARPAAAMAGLLLAGMVLGTLGSRPDFTGLVSLLPGLPRRMEADQGAARPTSAAPREQQSAASPSVEPAAAAASPAAAPPPVKEVRIHVPHTTPPPSAASPSPAELTPAQPLVGGELVFLVPGEPPSYDAHREETFALIHPAAPHYNTLLRIDPFDKTGTRVVGDLAASWAVSPDKRTYVLKLRRGVKFHDGSEMTSRDVKATYDKIINPPPGTTSARKGEYLEIETVQAPEPHVVAFKLKWPAPSFIHSLASPWNWIYKAEILQRDFRWYEKNIMGTGPFIFVEHVKGSHWIGRRNPEYWDRGKPYLNGYRAIFVRDDAAQVAAIRGERAHIQFRGFSPAQRDAIVRTLGGKVTVQESPWNCALVVAINHEKWPFDDRRVRRALSLALDRYQAAGALSRIAIVREVAGVQVPRSLFATSPAELVKLAGYWRDIRSSRAEARRLLAEAGGLNVHFVLKNRSIPMPYEHIGTWLVDQWRQIGLNVRQEIQESTLYFRDLRTGNFDVSIDFQCGYVVDPDLDLYKFQSRHRSHANYSRYTDPVLDDLYVLQSRTVDPGQRRRYLRAFEKRLLDEEAHYIYTLQWHRIVPHSARVRGWTITPSHYLNNQLDTVWLAK